MAALSSLHLAFISTHPVIAVVNDNASDTPLPVAILPVLPLLPTLYHLDAAADLLVATLTALNSSSTSHHLDVAIVNVNTTNAPLTVVTLPVLPLLLPL